MGGIKKNIAISENGFIFDPSTGDSFALNSSGKLIVDLIKGGRSEDEIKAAMRDQYDVDPGILENNYADFIQMLRFNKLLEGD